MINRALDALEVMSADSATRDFAERREKALKDETMFLNEARRLGRKEGRRETAVKLLGIKMLTLDQIAAVTDLDINEIEKLKAGIPA